MADAGVPIMEEEALAEPEEWEAVKNSKRVNDPILSHQFLQCDLGVRVQYKKIEVIFSRALLSLKNEMNKV